jgi:DinB family protein
MYDTPLTIEQVLTRLAAAPPHIAELTAGLSPAQLRAVPSDAGWSATDVLSHLRSCSDVWGDYIARILAEDHPTIRAVNPTTWIKKTGYPDLAFRPSLHSFTTQRADLLSVLQPLPPEAWSRAATVTGAGRPRVRTVLSYAQWLANHERSHFKQIERIVTTMQT